MSDGSAMVAAGWEAVRSGRPAEAERLGRQVLQADAGSAGAWFLVAVACQCQGRPAEAAECYTHGLRLQPNHADAHYSLGIVLRDLGRLAEAAECFRHTLRLRPDLPKAVLNLGIVLHELGRPAEAVEYYDKARRLRPDLPEGHSNLGIALRDLGRPAEAAECFRQALQVQPHFPDAHNNLGNVLHELGRPAEAVESYTQALRQRPEFAEAHYNLGNAQRDLGRLGDAAGHYKEAVRLRTDYADAHNNLGLVLRAMGRADEAAECFRRALALRPDDTVAHSNLLQTLHYQIGVTPQELAAAHADFQRRHAAPLRASWRPHGNDRDPERPLRLGFVSPDFGRHPVGYLLVRTIEALARQPGAIICYSDRRAPDDDVTARFRAASTWREVASLSDERLADLVRADAVDILFDLAGHTAGNRLLAFARKPAPVQCTWLGYVGTTGLEAIDYIIADQHQVPSGAEQHYRERVARLPGGYATYDAPATAPEPGPPPALASRQVTFGCLNNPAKLSSLALTLWAELLRRVPGSRLVLKYRGLDDSAVGGRLVEWFTEQRLWPERVELRGGSAREEHLATYRAIDIALDPFPYSGGLTTLDALWMGVPVVTLPGDTFASRHSLSHLAGVGLQELAARTADQYLALAAGLAEDLGRLADLRAGLRERVARSPLCDGDRLADELLAVLRDAWRAFCSRGL